MASHRKPNRIHKIIDRIQIETNRILILGYFRFCRKPISK